MCRRSTAIGCPTKRCVPGQQLSYDSGGIDVRSLVQRGHDWPARGHVVRCADKPGEFVRGFHRRQTANAEVGQLHTPGRCRPGCSRA